MKKRPEIEYTYRGMIERGADYHWVEGYSRTGESGEVWFPWLTRRECQSEAKQQGCKAVFIERVRK